jgi:hypothetical protein
MAFSASSSAISARSATQSPAGECANAGARSPDWASTSPADRGMLTPVLPVVRVGAGSVFRPNNHPAIIANEEQIVTTTADLMEFSFLSGSEPG